MKAGVSYLLRTYLYWLLLFFIARFIFVIYYLSSIKAPFSDILLTFFYSIRLDLSTATYLTVIPFILVVWSLIFPHQIATMHKRYIMIFTVIFSIITASELAIYSEWGTKLHYKALLFLLHPSEVIGSASIYHIIGFALSFAIQLWAAKFLYRKLFSAEEKLIRKPMQAISLSCLFIPVMVLGIRGGFNQIPVNQSDCYFSNDNILNLAAVNSGWNLLHSITENPGLTEVNPYVDVPIDEALTRVKNLLASADSSSSILNTSRPNIVLIILESWSSDLIPSSGGDPGATKNFESLIQDGLYFTNVIASGDRSDQGMAAIFSGFPAQPLTTIISQPAKFQRLPALGKSLKKEGYHTSFFFGGQLSYGNIKSYMIYNQLDKIVEAEDLPSDIPTGKLGAHDQYMYDIQLKELKNFPQPFFSSIFTLSTHSPFDMPLDKFPISWGKNENHYVNSVYYADSCLGDFFKKAKEESWYDNTLFVLVSDHSRNSHKNHEFISPEYHKIPLLFYGNVLKNEYRNRKIDRIVSQTDLPATLLSQLKISTKDYKWSRNALNNTSTEFAYYSFINGVGWVVPDGFYTFDYNIKGFHRKTLKDSSKTEDHIRNGKSYLQVMFNEYLSY